MTQIEFDRIKLDGITQLGSYEEIFKGKMIIPGNKNDKEIALKVYVFENEEEKNEYLYKLEIAFTIYHKYILKYFGFCQEPFGLNNEFLPLLYSSIKQKDNDENDDEELSDSRYTNFLTKKELQSNAENTNSTIYTEFSNDEKSISEESLPVQPNRMFCLIMEWIPCTEMIDDFLINSKRILCPNALISFTHMILQAMLYLSGHGIIYRNLSFQNIIVDKFNVPFPYQVKLLNLDFTRYGNKKRKTQDTTENYYRKNVNKKNYDFFS